MRASSARLPAGLAVSCSPLAPHTAIGMRSLAKWPPVSRRAMMEAVLPPRTLRWPGLFPAAYWALIAAGASHHTALRLVALSIPDGMSAGEADWMRLAGSMTGELLRDIWLRDDEEFLGMVDRITGGAPP